MNEKRLARIFFMTISALCLAALIAFIQVRMAGQPHTDSVVAENFGGPFTLVDHTGKTVTEKDFSGRYRLIYFGFTYCPAICPTELGKITQALKQLGPQADMITPLFITVDPARDTPDTLAKYITLFDKRLIGLSGTPEQIKHAAKIYKIYYNKVEDPQMNDYTMDHSSFIYFIDPDDNLIAVFRADDTADLMVTKITDTLARAGTN